MPGVAYSPTYAGSDAFALVSFEGGSNSVNRIPTAVAVALRATLRMTELHLYCASHREAATKFACANIQNCRRACGGSSLTIPCSSSHFCTYERRKLLASDTGAHCVRIVRNARAFGAQRCRWSVCDHARSRALFRPQTGRFTARTLGWNAEASSCETDCASRHAANLAARLF